MKVFCQKCTHCILKDLYIPSCWHPSNLKDSYFSEKSILIESPEIKNKNNDCKDYTDRELEEAKKRQEKLTRKTKWYLPWWVQ